MWRFLDPRFKSMSFLSQINKENIIQVVKEEAEKILLGLHERKASNSETSAKPPSKKPKRGLMALLDVVNSPNEDETMALTPEKSKAEAKKVHNYLCLDVAIGNPLTWWRQNEKHFPALQRFYYFLQH